jgi:TorA maturation chaperone TorD
LLDSALARAALYRAFGRSLRRVTPLEQERLFGPAGRDTLGEAAVLVAGGMDGFAELVDRWGALGGAGLEPIAESHRRLFGHSRGLVCPFETEYGAEGGFDQPQILADIAGSYLAFGLTPAPARDERVDHAACECEFLEFLARKEAYTLALLAKGQQEGGVAVRLEVVQKAARGFVREHLGRFGRAFASRLMREDDDGFYGALGAALFEFLTLECQRLGLPPGPSMLELRPPLPDPTPLACGSGQACAEAEELVQIRRRPRP